MRRSQTKIGEKRPLSLQKTTGRPNVAASPEADSRRGWWWAIMVGMEAHEYVHLCPGDAPPSLDDSARFKTVVVVDADVTLEWQGQISDWLVRSGCRYMMAWGRKCTEWDDSVDDANLARFDFGEIPETTSL